MSFPPFHPIQKLCYPSGLPGINFVLAATGPIILSLSLETGLLLSKWPESSQNVENATGSPVGHDSEGESAPKKRKLDSQPVEPTVILPKVSHIVSTRNGRHIVAVTADDKTVKVFALNSSGVLKVLSSRVMPKRPCALVLTRDDKTVLVGDKFGDVYALPLLPEPEGESQEASIKTQPKPTETFQPSASMTTVHTKGNREALRQQQLQKRIVQKQAPLFEKELVLGHVSLLTDLIVAFDPSKPEREFIMTADRDEHIRVSRSIPQAHVIQTYCQGHTKFVSKLLIDASRPDLLISAGGEPSLKLFDWLRGKLLSELDLSDELAHVLPTGDPPIEPVERVKFRDGNLSVSCLQSMKLSDDPDEDSVILLVFEGTPSIYLIRFDVRQGILKPVGPMSCVDTPLNVLDIVPLEPGICLVAMDTFHEPWEMKKTQDSRQKIPEISALNLRYGQSGERPIEQTLTGTPPFSSQEPSIFSLREPAAREKPKLSKTEHIASSLRQALKSEDCHHLVEVDKKEREGLYSTLGEFLYGLENLRKRVNMTAPEDVEAETPVPEP